VVAIGQYIKIDTPEPIERFSFIVEEEAVVKAKVISVTPDCSLPFKEGSTIFFYKNNHIINQYGIFLPLDVVVGYY
jgi:hypothetical protein